MGSPQEAVQIVNAVIISEAMQFFRYYAIMDDRTCQQCNRYDMSHMTRTEIQGTFPYLEKQSDYVWFPRVHPNCRCELRWEEESEEEPEVKVNVKTSDNLRSPEKSLRILKRIIHELPPTHAKDVRRFTITKKTPDTPYMPYGSYDGININIRDDALYDDEKGRHVVYHEIGHHVYYDDLTRDDRGEWREIWRKQSMPTSYAKTSSVEGFAECYTIYYESRGENPIWSKQAIVGDIKQFIEKVAKRGV